MAYADKDGLKKIMSNVKTYINSKTKNLATLDMVYPIGSIYMSVNSTPPRTVVRRNLGTITR